MNEQDILLSNTAVREMLYGISNATLYRWIKTQNFPQPIPLGPRCVRWSEAEVDAWIANRKALRSAA